MRNGSSFKKPWPLVQIGREKKKAAIPWHAYDATIDSIANPFLAKMLLEGFVGVAWYWVNPPTIL